MSLETRIAALEAEMPPVDVESEAIDAWLRTLSNMEKRMLYEVQKAIETRGYTESTIRGLLTPHENECLTYLFERCKGIEMRLTDAELVSITEKVKGLLCP